MLSEGFKCIVTVSWGAQTVEVDVRVTVAWTFAASQTVARKREAMIVSVADRTDISNLLESKVGKRHQ